MVPYNRRMGHSAPPLSVVIVTFRNAATLPGALDALRRETPAETELLIVENGGDLTVKEVVQTVWPNATVMVNSENRGFASGVNQGVRFASSPTILLLNPDAEVEPGSVAALF